MIGKKTFVLAVAVSWILTLVTVLLISNFAPNIIQPFNEQISESNSTQKTPLEVTNIVMKKGFDDYILRATVYLPDGISTLYNCYMEVDYLTENDSWKTVSKDIGIVNYEENIAPQLYLDSDFKSTNPYLETGGNAFHGDEEPNVRVEAYGFLKP